MKDSVVISDIYDDISSITQYYPSPQKKQEHSRRITDYNNYLKDATYDNINSNDIYYSIINRMTTVIYDFTLFSGIVENIQEKLVESGVNTLVLKFNKKNYGLYSYLKRSLTSTIVTIEFHNADCIEFNIKDSENISRVSFAIINFTIVFFFVLTLVLSNFLKVIYKIFSKVKLESDCLWMSYANNRESEDYNIIKQLVSEGVNVIHPQVFPIKKKSPYTKYVLFYPHFTVKHKAVMAIISSLRVFYREDILIGQMCKSSKLSFPLHYQLSKRIKILLHYINSIVLSDITNNIEKPEHKRIKLIFRGGNADGIILATTIEHNKVILLPHGTEFYPIDHSTINFIDTNILVSQEAVINWSNDNYQSRKVDLKPFGRPYYKYLEDSILSSSKNNSLRPKIGIVLTYGSNKETINFIDQVIDATQYIKGEFDIIIKQRPNLRHNLSNSKYRDSLQEFEGDIFAFLSCIDLVVVGVSPFGVVGMVGTDAIYCDIPTIFYFGDKTFSKYELGYSWSDALNKSACFSYQEILSIFDGNDFESIKKEVLRNQMSGKSLLGRSDESIDTIIEYIKGTD